MKKTKAKRLHQLGKLIVACEVYIVHQNKVLMHKRAKSKKKFPGFWIGPGGHVDEGEDVMSAAIREAKEETGVRLKEKDIRLKVLAFHHHLDRKEVWIEYLFRADIPKRQKVISTKEGKSKWIDQNKLMKMKNVFPPSRYYFDHILKDKTGILYNYSQWKSAKLHKLISQRIDRSY